MTRHRNGGEISLSWFGKTLWKHTPLYVELVFLAACLRLIGLVEPLIFQVVIDRILPFQFVVHLAFGPFLRRRLRVQFDAGATASDKSAELARASAMRFVRWTPLMGCQRLVGVSGTVRPHLGPTVLMSIR